MGDNEQSSLGLLVPRKSAKHGTPTHTHLDVPTSTLKDTHVRHTHTDRHMHT